MTTAKWLAVMVIPPVGLSPGASGGKPEALKVRFVYAAQWVTTVESCPRSRA